MDQVDIADKMEERGDKSLCSCAELVVLRFELGGLGATYLSSGFNVKCAPCREEVDELFERAGVT
jgi:hypothetical protein